MKRNAHRCASGWMAVAAATWMALSPPAFAQIYKCVTHGQLAYQDSPCPGNARSTVIEGAPKPPADLLPGLPPESPPTMEQLMRATAGYRPPATLSLKEIYALMQTLGVRERAFRAGMDKDMQAGRDRFQASLRDRAGARGITSAWMDKNREGTQRVKALTDQSMRLHRDYTQAMQAALHGPVPSGDGASASQATQARTQTIARLHAQWDPRLRDIDAEVRAAARDVMRENQTYAAKLHADDAGHDIRALRDSYMAYARRVQGHWLPFIRITELQKQALQDELRRRCPSGASLTPERQVCLKP